MNKLTEWRIEDMISGTPMLKTKNVKAVDVLQLLKDINSMKSITIAEINNVILNQQQYDLVVLDE